MLLSPHGSMYLKNKLSRKFIPGEFEINYQRKLEQNAESNTIENVGGGGT